MNVASQLDTAELAACSQNADGVTTGPAVPPDQTTGRATCCAPPVVCAWCVKRCMQDNLRCLRRAGTS